MLIAESRPPGRSSLFVLGWGSGCAECAIGWETNEGIGSDRLSLKPTSSPIHGIQWHPRTSIPRGRAARAGGALLGKTVSFPLPRQKHELGARGLRLGALQGAGDALSPSLLGQELLLCTDQERPMEPLWWWVGPVMVPSQVQPCPCFRPGPRQAKQPGSQAAPQRRSARSRCWFCTRRAPPQATALAHHTARPHSVRSDHGVPCDGTSNWRRLAGAQPKVNSNLKCPGHLRRQYQVRPSHRPFRLT